MKKQDFKKAEKNEKSRRGGRSDPGSLIVNDWTGLSDRNSM